MPAAHPLQRLARCTGHKESDDAFWAIMDWQSEDEHKEKKAVQKTKKPKGNPPGQGTHHKEASHAAPFRGLDPRKVGAAVAESGVPAGASTSSSSGGRGDPVQEQAIRAQAVAQRRAVETPATGNPTRPVGDQVWHPSDLAGCQEPHGRQNLRHHRAQRGAQTTKLGDSHNR